MLNIESAKKKGIDACINALGKDFCLLHKDNALSGYEEPHDNIIRCFVTISDKPPGNNIHESGGDLMPYQAFVDVDMETGQTILIKVIRP